MLNKLFRFPIAMIDGENEDRKQKKAEDMALDDEFDVDMIIGEAECPYYDFVSISDRWLPTDESFKGALEGKFDACFVTFGSCGSFIVPWNKGKFKKELQKFIDKQPKEIQMTVFDPNILQEIVKKQDE